jgi:hypothetical protein
MGWFRRREAPAGEPPEEGVDRLTSRGRRDVDCESTTLDDRETVLKWVRDLRPDQDVQIFVNRSWGVVFASGGDGQPPGVIMGDGEHAWYAVPPGGGEKANLTPEQLERLMLEAMSSPDRPSWPDWHQIA